MKLIRMILKTGVLFALLGITGFGACGCSQAPLQSGQNIKVEHEEEKTAGDIIWDDLKEEGELTLFYADQYRVMQYEDGYARIDIEDGSRYLLIPEGKPVPSGVPSDVIVLMKPFRSIYLAASSAMDFFRCLDELQRVHMVSTNVADWSFPDVKKALENEDMFYVGKYRAPDYEFILDEVCDLAIESTMIYHSPQVKEQLERLGIPVFVERSSYEKHPLGRLEWIRLYGLLLDHQEEADAYFYQQSDRLKELSETAGPTEDADAPKAAFFYVSSSGSVNVRRPDDYISRMIQLAGGQYIFENLPVDHGKDAAVLNMQMETFYAAAKDADILIYNSTVDGAFDTMEDLLKECSLLQDFAAVQSGQVWCTNQSMFQETTGMAEMILELNRIMLGDAEDQMTYFHRLIR